jgi:hypothetical protein
MASVLALAVLDAGVAADAYAEGPAVRVDAVANTTVAPGGTLQYAMQVTNVGSAPTDGSEIDLLVTLSAGMTALQAGGGATSSFSGFTCTAGDGVSPVAGASVIDCKSMVGEVLPAAASSEPVLTVQVDPAAAGVLTASFVASGGGAASSSSTVRAVEVTAEALTFGVTAFDGQAVADPTGTPSTQAGGHPYELSTSIDFPTTTNPNPLIGSLWPVAAVKDTFVDLPPGVLGNPTVADRCTISQLAHSDGIDAKAQCAPTSQVGTVFIRAKGLILGIGPVVLGPIPLFNLVPPDGSPAEFGFNVFGSLVAFDASVRSGGDYGLTIRAKDISEGIAVTGVTVSFWGTPADPSHDGERACPGQKAPWQFGLSCPSGAPVRALLRNTTSCAPQPGGPADGLATTLHVDSWTAPGRLAGDGSPDLSDPNWHTAQYVSHAPPAYPYPTAVQGAHLLPTGCDKVPFTPSIDVQPTSHTADSATGLTVNVTVPQAALSEPGATSQADMRKAVVRLPEGVTINPTQAAGLAACSTGQIGYLGNSFPAPFKIRLSDSEPSCPDASKIGKFEVETPLLDKTLQGNVYLAAQSDNPFGSVIALYLVAKGDGVIVKIPAHVEADSVTGRLTTTLDSLPQFPVSKVTLELDSGARAPLINPTSCGVKTVESTLEGWNDKSVTITRPWTVDCTAGLGGFKPTFTGGTVNNQAGAFTPFVLSFARNDGEQHFTGLAETLPPGASAVLRGVALCPDADAAAGTCPAASRIGSVSVGAGAGSNPFFLKGSVYLTGPYNGGPYGEVVVVPAVAGPFNLGNVIVRGSIRIDPNTAQPTIVSDPLPQFVNQTGIPTDVRRVDVTLDRPSFTFNPTDCDPLSVTGTLTSTQGTTAPVSSRFQAANCATLKFHPTFKVSTLAHTTRKIGAQLHVVVTSGPGQADIHSVHVILPKALPSRLPTLQLACPDTVFSANPASCGPGSRIGVASAHTPLLTGTLTGPVYFVSHGGVKFPDLVVVLQSEGVTVDLTGHTFIKGEVTSSTFDTLPDVPVTRFELTLPQGPHSVLAAVKPLCKAKLVMPVRIVGQNGAVLTQSTKVAVSGCPKAKKRKFPQAHNYESRVKSDQR